MYMYTHYTCIHTYAYASYMIFEWYFTYLQVNVTVIGPYGKC